MNIHCHNHSPPVRGGGKELGRRRGRGRGEEEGERGGGGGEGRRRRGGEEGEMYRALLFS